MIKKLAPFKKEDKEDETKQFWLNEWTWNSHLWIETIPGHYKCYLCKKEWNYNYLGEYDDFCKENQKIKDLLKKYGVTI